jgi:hypothetical protein
MVADDQTTWDNLSLIAITLLIKDEEKNATESLMYS